jgi:hypothetical protein
MNNEQPHFELPPVQLNQTGEQSPQLGEAAAPSQEQLAPPINMVNQGAPMPVLPPDPAQIAAAQTPIPDPGAAPQDPASAPGVADDSDLIEKAWVEKAKEIVGRTKDDPYLQNREINKFKADYIKKRYNKDIKVSEE